MTDIPTPREPVAAPAMAGRSPALPHGSAAGARLATAHHPAKDPVTAASGRGGRDALHPVRRVLFFGKSKSTSGTTRAIVQGLRALGIRVDWVNCALLKRWLGERWMRAWVRRQFVRHKPDAVVSFFCDIPSDLLAEFHATCRTAIWNEECVVPLDPSLRTWMAHCDLLCLNNTAQIEDYRGLGAAQVDFVMSGYSPAVHQPLDLRWLDADEPTGQVYDLAFIGSPGHGERRAEMVLSLCRDFDVHVFGRGWDTWRGRSSRLHLHGAVKPHDFARICAQARIVLGMNWINSVPFYFSNRTWMTLGCGGFHLTHYVPGLEQIFGQGEHLAWFRDFDELHAQAAKYLAQPRLRHRIARAGHALVRNQHTYEHRMARLVEVLAQVPLPTERSAGARVAGANGTGANGNGANGNGTHGAGAHAAANGATAGAVLAPAPRLPLRGAPPASVRVRPDATP